jgi:ribonuclease Y
MNPIITGVIALLVGAAGGWLVAWWKQRAATGQLQSARQEAENIRRDAKIAGQEEWLRIRETFEKESKERRQELAETEKRLIQRETNLDRKVDWLDRKTEDVTKRESQIVEREKELHKLQEELDELKRQAQRDLQRISCLSHEEARRQLLAQETESCRAEGAALARHILDDAKRDADREAKRVITMSIERLASNHVQATTSCTVVLPTEETKGRIIGREGRNIRAFEAVTGVNVLIDDTPQAVVLSGFDPVRRELARITMERLVVDGRINPARIEEEAGKAQLELDAVIQKAGEDALFELGVQKVHPELVTLLGRLRFRHSFSQNVLAHSVEVARLVGMMAAELGLNEPLAKRIGLFHDIGKSMDHQVEGSHAIIGADLLRKHGESEEVAQAVAGHHHEAEPATVYGVLTSAADAISAARPGARSESMELYLERLEKLEALATGFPGVEKCYALQAGREIRVLVEPGKINDDEAVQLARNISKKVEQELQYPGQIKVTVIRETRAVEFAK